MNLFLLYTASATVFRWARVNWKKAIHESWNRCSIRLWISVRCLNALSVYGLSKDDFFLNIKKEEYFDSFEKSTWIQFYESTNKMKWSCISEAKHAALINSLTLLHPFAMVHNYQLQALAYFGSLFRLHVDTCRKSDATLSSWSSFFGNDLLAFDST